MSVFHHTYIQITLLCSAVSFMDIPLLSPQQSSEQRLGFLFFVSTIAIAGQKRKKNLALKPTIVGKLNLGLLLDVFSGCPQLLCLNLRTDSMGRSLKKGVKSREDEKQEAPFPGCSPEKMSIFSRGWALGGSIRRQMA